MAFDICIVLDVYTIVWGMHKMDKNKMKFKGTIFCLMWEGNGRKDIYSEFPITYINK